MLKYKILRSLALGYREVQNRALKLALEHGVKANDTAEKAKEAASVWVTKQIDAAYTRVEQAQKQTAAALDYEEDQRDNFQAVREDMRNLESTIRREVI